MNPITGANSSDCQFQQNQQRLHGFNQISNLNKLKELSSNCMLGSSTTMHSSSSPNSDKQNYEIRISLMELNQENVRLLQQINQIKQESNEDIRSLTTKIQSLNGTIRELSSMICIKELEIEQNKYFYESQIISQQSEIKLLKQSDSNLKHEIVKLRQVLSQISDNRTSEQQQKMKYQNLASEFSKLHQQNYNLHKENQKLKEKNNALKGQITTGKTNNYKFKLNLKALTQQKSQTESLKEDRYKTDRDQRKQITNNSPSSGLRSDSKFCRRILGCQLNSVGKQNSLNSHRLINMEQDLYENSGQRLFNKQNYENNQDHSSIYTISGPQQSIRNNTIKECFGQSNPNITQTSNPNNNGVVSPFKSVFDQLIFDQNQSQILKDMPVKSSFLKNKPQQKSKPQIIQPSKQFNPFLDPYYAFFTLTVQTTKLNSPFFDQIVNFDLQKQWSYLKQNMTYNLWPSYLAEKLRNFQKNLIQQIQVQRKSSKRDVPKSLKCKLGN